MGKFLYLYRGPATPVEEFTEEQSAEQMAAWGKWTEQAGSALVNLGEPVGAKTAIRDDGSTAEASDVNGYTIVEADDLDGAKALAADHPFLAEGKGRFTLEIFELVPM
jgi:hypothetical protein